MPAMVVAVALLAGACATEPVDQADLAPATTTTTTTIPAPTDEGSDALAFAAEQPTELGEQVQPDPAPTGPAGEICEALAPLYVARATLRTTLLTATEQESTALLEDMSTAQAELSATGAAEHPDFDVSAVSSLIRAEWVLPRRVNSGGAISLADMEQSELDAAPVHTFARTHCDNIGEELLAYGPVVDRAEDVFAFEESARLITYCTHLETILTQRWNLRAAIANGELDDAVRSSFIDLFGEWDTTRSELIELNDFVDWTDSFEFALVDFVEVEMELRQATLGPGYIPVSDHTVEMAERANNAVTESAERVCPDLSSDLIADPPAMETYVSETFDVPPEILRLDDFNTAEDYCIRAIPLLYAHDALVQHLEALDPSNKDQWVDARWVAYRLFSISGSIGNTVELLDGGNAERSAIDAFSTIAIDAIYGDPPRTVEATWEREQVATIRSFTASQCPTMPDSLKGEPGSALELLVDLAPHRPEVDG